MKSVLLLLLPLLLALILRCHAFPFAQITPYLDPVITTYGDAVPLSNGADSEPSPSGITPTSNESTTSATPTEPEPTTTPKANLETIVYWGLSPEERPLREYCNSDQGISTVALSFLTSWGSGSGYTSPGGKIGNCSIGAGESPCTGLQSDIDYCKSQGVKVLVSLGGANITSGLTSEWDAQTTAQSLWNSWAAPAAILTNITAPRPIGQSFVDGFDFDVETNVGDDAALLPHMVSYLRSLFPRDTANTYLISGAPQCPLPEVNMGTAISESQFDLLFIQYYNNPVCSAYQTTSRGDGGSFNWAAWQDFVASGASKNAKLFVGLPASSMGSSGDDDGAEYFLQPGEMLHLVREIQDSDNFGGVMLWDAYHSDIAATNGCTYVQNARRVLDTNTIC